MRILILLAIVLSCVNSHDTGDNPHMQSDFDSDEGTFTYILKVPKNKKSECQCEDELENIQEQLDALELRFEKVLGKLNSVTFAESLDRINDGDLEDGVNSDMNGTFTDDLSPSDRVSVNASDSDKNGTLVKGPDDMIGISGMESGNVMHSNGTLQRSIHRSMNRGDAPENLINTLNEGQLPKPIDTISPAPLTVVSSNNIKTGGRNAEGSDELVDDGIGLTVELAPDSIKPAKTSEDIVINVEEEKKLTEVIAKQDIDDQCAGGCACFKDTTETGVYAIKRPKQFKKKSTHIKVYCDMKTDHGGWTVIQRRVDGEENFFRSWAHYARGFGNKNKDFWIGNNIIHAITSSGKYELRIEFEDWEGQQGFAHYDRFEVLDEQNKFRLLLGKFVGGNRGDSMSYHNNTAFTTKDRDNDWFYGNCAILRKSGFWFKECNHANPNGVWIGKGDGSGMNGSIITWGSWGTYGYKYCMKTFKMMIRPTNHR